MSGPQDSTAPQTPSLIRQTLSHRAISFLTGRYLPLSLAALAMLLASPALWAGWLMDDHFHRLRIMGSSYFPDCYGASWDLFRFFDGDPARTHRMMDAGMLPWWTYEKVQAGFWRPLTVLTHWIDYSLWPGSPALMHAQSLLWLGGLVGVTVALYRRILGVTAIAGLAALLFALDDAHALPVGFLANRNALPCALFGVLSLIAHDRWRRDGWRWGGLWGPLLFVLSLLAKEAGVSVLAYLVAYALFLDRAAVSRRFVALLPYAVLLIVWRMLWSWQGYGVHGLGLYIDPLAEPLRFVSAIIDHAPFLLLGQWALPPAEIAITLENGALEAMWYATCVSLAFISRP